MRQNCKMEEKIPKLIQLINVQYSLVVQKNQNMTLKQAQIFYGTKNEMKLKIKSFRYCKKYAQKIIKNSIVG